MHANARLSVWGRHYLVEQCEAGVPLADLARRFGISRQTASKWWNRYLDDPTGPWYEDRSSASPHPARISAELEADIVQLRRTRRWGPAQIAAQVGVSSATVWRVLKAEGLHQLRFLHHPVTAPPVRYERARPGELIHLDTKRYGRIPDGGGSRVLGVAGYRTYQRQQAAVGYVHVHAAVDDHSRIAHAAEYPDATAPSCSDFLIDTISVFAAYGIVGIEEAMTDNAKAYTSRLFTATRTDWGIRHLLIRPYRPQTNGKVERFHQTLKREWATAILYHSEHERAAALDSYLTYYNTLRHHTAIGGPPISRVNNHPE